MSNKPKALIVNCNGEEKSQGVPALEAMAAAIGFEALTVNAFLHPEELPRQSAGYDFIVFSGGPGDPALDGKWNAETAALADDVLAHNAAFPQTPIYTQFICLSHQNLFRHKGLSQTSRRANGHKFGVHAETFSDGAIVHTMANQQYQVDDNGLCAEVDLHGLTLRTTSRCAENNAIVAAEIANAAGEIVGRSTQYHPEATAETVHWLLHHEDAKGFQSKVVEHHGKDALDIQRANVMALKQENDRLREFAQTAYDAALSRRKNAVSAPVMTPAA